LLSKLLDDTHDPFSIRSPGDEAASFANLLETPRLHPTNTRPQRAGPSSLFSLKEVSNELAVSLALVKLPFGKVAFIASTSTG
jgi:hypothetical protein